MICLDKKTGEIRWEQDACRGVPQVKRHPKSSHANTSVATDGKHVVVFLGSEGLYCCGVEGELLWKRDFGLINSAWHVVESAEWEFCSSPVIYQDKVIIQADALNTAFVAVLDLFTGETIWRKERDEITGWCTPNIYFDGDKPRLAVNGYKHRGGFDFFLTAPMENKIRSWPFKPTLPATSGTLKKDDKRMPWSGLRNAKDPICKPSSYTGTCYIT